MATLFTLLKTNRKRRECDCNCECESESECANVKWSMYKTMILHIARRLSRPVANVKSSSIAAIKCPVVISVCCMCIQYNKLSYRFNCGTKVCGFRHNLELIFSLSCDGLRCYLMNGMWIAYVINSFPFHSLMVILLDHESNMPNAQCPTILTFFSFIFPSFNLLLFLFRFRNRLRSAKDPSEK